MGVGLALRVRVGTDPHNIRGVTPGLYLYVGATPSHFTAGGHENPGGLARRTCSPPVLDAPVPVAILLAPVLEAPIALSIPPHLPEVIFSSISIVIPF